MVFSSLVFLFIFLPCTLAIYYAIPKRLKNDFLLLASLIFFAWAGVSYSILIFLSITVNYFIGKKLETPKKRFYIWLGCSFNLIMLIIFKYTNFIVANINEVFHFINLSSRIPQTSIVLPIGISFYTFQAMSYLIDVYYNRTQVQRRIDHLGLYIALFPQLIAGPIVRYHEIKEQLAFRIHSTDLFVSGIYRFIAGLGKKVLLANTVALIVDHLFAQPVNTIDPLTAWCGIILYALQIFFDFSGYSDMAVGLGRMFGFKIPENFNFPYIARSIRDFWRRWHITLSNWFRDYLYIPLGGNRKGKGRTYLNLFIVFIITGFWHGASWNFLIWGLFHGIFLIIERTRFMKVLQKSGSIFQHLYTLLIVLFAWVFFRSDTLSYAVGYCKTMIGLGTNESLYDMPLIMKFISSKNIFFVLIAILACTPIYRRSWNKVNVLFQPQRNAFYTISHELLAYTKMLAFMTILVICIMELAVGTYNPFIYFRF